MGEEKPRIMGDTQVTRHKKRMKFLAVMIMIHVNVNRTQIPLILVSWLYVRTYVRLSPNIRFPRESSLGFNRPKSTKGTILFLRALWSSSKEMYRPYVCRNNLVSGCMF
eukprot:12459018-Ditylum_brightwellii.AAC.1